MMENASQTFELKVEKTENQLFIVATYDKLKLTFCLVRPWDEIGFYLFYVSIIMIMVVVVASSWTNSMRK